MSTDLVRPLIDDPLAFEAQGQVSFTRICTSMESLLRITKVAIEYFVSTERRQCFH